MKTHKTLRLDIITLFPGMFTGPLTESLLGKAQTKGLIDLRIHNLRKFSSDARHKTVDDRPFGGGAGMVLQPEPIYRALRHIRENRRGQAKPYIIYLSPQGSVLNQMTAQALSKRPWMVF